MRAGAGDASGSAPEAEVARPRVDRLKRRADFVAAGSGLKVAGKSFILQARSRGDDGPPRVGFTVSGKVGTAVERNRVRRRLREAVRRSDAPCLKPGHDYVLIGRRAALATPFEDLLIEFASALHKAQRGAGTKPQRTVRGG